MGPAEADGDGGVADVPKWDVFDSSMAETGPETPDIPVEAGPRPADLGADCETCSGNDAAFVSQDVPLAVTIGSKFMVTIRMKNTGVTTWTDDEDYLLGFQNPQDSQAWGTGTRCSNSARPKFVRSAWTPGKQSGRLTSSSASCGG